MSDINDDPLMKISNIKNVAKHIGKDIAKEMKVPIKEMKEYITPKEIVSLVKQYSIKRDKDYLMNTLILKKIFLEVRNWAMGVQLAKMASSGDIESLWDSEQNCMVFQSK